MWIRSLLVDRNDGNIIFVGGNGGNVYRTIDGGASWSLAGATGSGGTRPPGGGNGLAGGQAQLSVELNFLGANSSVNAGSNARFTVTVKNNGPDTSSNTIVDFNWVEGGPSGDLNPGYTGTTSQGSCGATSTDAIDCSLGSIPSGGIVQLQFSGSTKPDRASTYDLQVWADNAESSNSAWAGILIDAKVARTCFLIFYTTESSGGGGATTWPMLLILFVLAVRRQFFGG
ncbi:MAG: GlyGly-CTERM sorting domain-containing protein [Woeseia sp.]